MKLVKKIKILMVVKIFLWLIVGWQTGLIINNLFHPHALKIDFKEENIFKKEYLNLVNLFGGYSENKILSTDIKIIGLVAGANDGSIIISFKDGPNQIIKLGKKSKSGLIFEGFFNDSARFKYEEKIIEVPYIFSKKNLDKKNNEDVDISI